MMFSDREWLRFVTFAIVAGGAIGASYTGAMAVNGHTIMWSVSAGVISAGLIAIIAHVALRHILDEASEPPAEPTDPDDAADTADTADAADAADAGAQS